MVINSPIDIRNFATPACSKHSYTVLVEIFNNCLLCLDCHFVWQDGSRCNPVIWINSVENTTM